jgi:membrane protease YdiL (CAAX protease family)
MAATNPTDVAKYSKLFYYTVPFLVPLIVFALTYIFYFVEFKFRWIPLICIYWGTLWTFILMYHKKVGGVFTAELYHPTFKLRGDHLPWQYLLLYGSLIYSIPLYFINYFSSLSTNMLLAILVASVVNGASEEIFWRGCMDQVGKDAGMSEKQRFIYLPIVFAFWHTAFVYHLVPWDSNWWTFYGMILLMTWLSGVIWLWVLQRSKRLFPQIVMHAVANFLNIFPMLLITVIQLSF